MVNTKQAKSTPNLIDEGQAAILGLERFISSARAEFAGGSLPASVLKTLQQIEGKLPDVKAFLEHGARDRKIAALGRGPTFEFLSELLQFPPHPPITDPRNVLTNSSRIYSDFHCVTRLLAHMKQGESGHDGSFSLQDFERAGYPPGELENLTTSILKCQQMSYLKPLGNGRWILDPEFGDMATDLCESGFTRERLLQKSA